MGENYLSENCTNFFLAQELLISPNDFYANFFSGVVASSENKHEKAIAFLKKAALIDPKRGEVYLFLGQSQFELNDLVAAEKNLRRRVGRDQSSYSRRGLGNN